MNISAISLGTQGRNPTGSLGQAAAPVRSKSSNPELWNQFQFFNWASPTVSAVGGNRGPHCCFSADREVGMHSKIKFLRIGCGRKMFPTHPSCQKVQRKLYGRNFIVVQVLNFFPPRKSMMGWQIGMFVTTPPGSTWWIHRVAPIIINAITGSGSFVGFWSSEPNSDGFDLDGFGRCEFTQGFQ